MTHPWPFKSIPGAHEGGTGDGPDSLPNFTIGHIGLPDIRAWQGHSQFCSTTAYERAQADIGRLLQLLERARPVVGWHENDSDECGVTARALLADIDKERRL